MHTAHECMLATSVAVVSPAREPLLLKKRPHCKVKRSGGTHLLHKVAGLWLLFVVELLIVASNMYAAGYTDDHADGSYSATWTVYGSRTWSETGGYAVPADANNNQGFLINNYSCTNDGTFEATIKALTSYNNYHGGIVFRWTSTSSYFFLTLYEQDPNGTNVSNAIKVFSNTTDWSGGTPLVTISNLNFTGLSSSYPIKVVMVGNDFTIYLNGASVGTFNSSAHSSGRVGYAYHSNWVLYTKFDASTWTDGGGSSGGGTEDYSTWSYSTTIKLNTKASGANVSGNVLNFPVLVRLSTGIFPNFSQTLSGGADIRFAKTNGTHIPYQIEQWTNSTSADIWVKIDTVYGNDSTQSFKMYWGKTGAVDSSSFFKSSVFSTSNNFVGVWHMQDDPNGDASGAVKDATANANNGTPTGSMTTGDLVTAQVGKGIDFDGSNDGITIPDAASLDITSGLTVSGWVKPNSVSGYVRIFAKASSDPNSAPYNVYSLNFNGSNRLQGMLYNNSSTSYYVNGSSDLSTGSFVYAVFRLSGTTMSLYLDGTAQTNTTTFSGTIATTSTVATIGKAGAATDYFSGIIDEVVVSNTARSDDWIKLCYQNQQATQTLATVLGDYTWDVNTSSGYSPGSGTWGSNSYWTSTGGGGTVLASWPGAGNSATFTNAAEASYTITVSGTQNVDSLTFPNSGYTLSSGTAINLGSKRGIYVASGKSVTISTPLAGSGGLTLTGGGTLTTGGTNTYTGATTITNGTFLVTGSTNSGSAVTVGSGGVLGGTGTVSGTVTANGDISPGTGGIGTLTIGSSLTFSGTGVLNSSLNGTASYDQVVMSTGTLTLANAVLNLSLGFAPSNGNTFTIINNGGSGAVNGTFSGRSEGSSISLSYGGNSYNFTISYNTSGAGNDVVLTCQGAATPDNYATWSYSANLTLNTTASGANVPNNVLNFPVLLRLNTSNFTNFSQTLANGTDLRFAKTDGVHIPYKIERWVDGASDADYAEIWLKIDTVYGNNSTQAFKMYWGKAGAADSSNGTLVFDVANGFTGAWSLNESGGPAIDYTSNQLNAAQNGNVPNRTEGMVGYGETFDGNGDYYNAGTSSKFDMSTDDKVTIMAWVKPAGNAVNGTIEGIATKWRWSGTTAYEYALAEDQNNGFFFAVSGSGSDYVFLYDSVGAAPSNGTWYHVVGQMGGGKMRIYVNGTRKDSTAKTTIAPTTSNSDFKIGVTDDDGGSYRQYFNGIIDQVTLSNTDRSADWIKLCYENQKATQTLVVFASDYTWDINSSSGYAAGDGTWGTNLFWSRTGSGGTTPGAWPGVGNSATFAGGSNGWFSITVSGTQYVDSMSFLDSTYNLSGGTAIDMGTKKGIYVAPTKKAMIHTPLIASNGIVKYGTGKLILHGATDFSGSVTVSAGVFMLGANGTGGAVNGNVTVNDSLVFNRSDDYAFTGAVSGTGKVVKQAAGKVTLSDAWTHSAGTYITAGTLQVGSGGTTGSISGTIGNSTALIFNRSNSYTYGSVVSGTGTVTQNGSNSLIFTGTNTYTGITTITTGTLEIGAGGTVGALSNSSNITNNSALVVNRSDAYAYSGVISGSGTFAKQGAGTLTLSGANTYTGTTTISGGILSVTGSLASGSTVNVASGATLAGTGTIAGSVAVSGTLTPGVDGSGTLTLGASGKDFSFVSGATLRIDANGTAIGTGYDQIVQTGTVTLGADLATLTFTLGYAAAVSDAFVIINNDAADAVTGTFSGLSEGGTFVVTRGGSAYTCSISYQGGDGNDVVVTVATVEETAGYSVWGYSQSIYLNTTATGANVTSDVYNFPVLVRLNSGNFDFFNQTQPGGKDIRFTKSDGSELRYSIERWADYDNDLDTAEIWVKVDTVYGNNRTQSFKMYWGKSDAADSSNSAKVFEASNGFVGVWHLNEDPSGGAASIKDASENGLHATPKGSMNSADLVGGMIGKAHDFEGNDVAADSVPYSALLNTANTVTLSAWVKPAGWNNYSRIITRGMLSNSDPYTVYSLATNGTSNQFRAEVSQGTGGTQNSVNGVADLGTATWYYIVFTYDKAISAMKLFRNGVQDGSTTSEADVMSTSETTPLMIGKSNYVSNPFSGIIDEAVVSNVARNQYWIKLCYENQKTSQSLVSMEDYSTWGFSRNITINTSGVTTTDCIGFPLLVRLTSTTFDFAQARDSGQDVRFSKSNGSRLAYQIERWDKTNKLAELWVRVDTVYGANSSQYIIMYWGNGIVGSRSNGAAVFGSDNYYSAVYQLGQSSGAALDITSTANNGTQRGDLPDQRTGIIGNSQNFDGAGDYFSCGTGTDLDMTTNTNHFTVSAWVKIAGMLPSGSTEQGIVTKWQWNGSGYDWELYFDQASGKGFAFYLYNGTTATKVDDNVAYPDTGGTVWYHCMATYDNATAKLYVNGQSSPASATISSGIHNTAGAEVRLGLIDSNATIKQYLKGDIDHVTISKTDRSADWIKLCYYTQKADASVLTADSADAFRPLGVRRYATGTTLDSVYVGTNRWALRFAANKGGGITFLAKDTAGATVNQLDANLFGIIYNSVATDGTTGTLELLDSSIVFSRIRQAVTLSGQPFTIDYTVLGNGKLYTRVYALAQAALSGGLEFRVANKTAGTYRNITFGSTAATCKGVAHVDSTSGMFDIVLAPYDYFTDADAITTNSKYTGIKSTSWSSPAGRLHSWEFMVDFSHLTLDSTSAYRYAASYRNSDTLGFYAGTPILEEAWEQNLKAQWAFDEGTGNTVADRSINGRTATISGTAHWTGGKWFSGADSLGGSDSITTPHSTDYGNANKTMMAWIKPRTSLNSAMSIVKKMSSANSGFELSGSAAGKVQFTVSNGGNGVTLEGRTALTAGVWYHVAARMFILNGQDFMMLYLNGKPDTVLYTSLLQYNATNTDALVIGKNFNGVVEDVRYYTENLTDAEIKAVYLKGFSPGNGWYSVRADNNNTVHCRMHGYPDSRYLPAMEIKNWWSSTIPTYVYVDGVGLTSGTDYFAALDDNRNKLVIGFNRVVNRNSAIYIDDNVQNGNQRVGPTRKMYWGVASGNSEYFWVKNTSGTSFGASSANEFYMNWKMDHNNAKDGELWQMRSSVTNPYARIDTSTGTNLVPGSDEYNVGFGSYSIAINGNDLRSTGNVGSSFTYAVEESSQVRIRLRINQRLVSSTDNHKMVTRWTLYPTGQFFRYDSIYQMSGTPQKVYCGVNIDDQTYVTFGESDAKIRALIINSQSYPDVAGAWLALKNTSGFQAVPFDADVITTNKSTARAGFDFEQHTSAPAKWNSASVEAIYGIDIHHSAMNASSMDSIANGVQLTKMYHNPTTSYRRALSMITGTLDSTTAGDFSDGRYSGGDGDGDGFNEMEGAYILGAANNTVKFVLPAHGDTCRYYPAFRITGYTAVNRPEYVYVYKPVAPAAGDTIALLEGYQFNSYVNQSTHELLLQIDSIFCDSVGIYISSDKTLAVKMSSFDARSGSGCDTLLWRTESEHENLGYRIVRRINPAFFDSMMVAYREKESVPLLSDSLSGIHGLVKRRRVQYSDTGWVAVNKRLIPGAATGTSVGPRDYRYVDRGVFNDLQYDYKLIAVDFRQTEEEHGPVSVVPRHVAPAMFMLGLNYPNPFRYATRIRFALPEECAVSLRIYTMQGRLVKTLLAADKKLSADYHTILWDGTNDRGQMVAAGQYIYRFSTKKYVRSKMMLCIH